MTVPYNQTRWTVRNITATATLSTLDVVVVATGGGIDVNLPTIIGNDGKVYIIKNNGGGNKTVDPFGAETIDGSSTVNVSNNSSITIVADEANTNWVIV